MCLGRPVISAWMPDWPRSSLRRTTMLSMVASRLAPFLQLTGDLLVHGRVDVAEGQVLQFPLHLPHAQTVGQRSKDLKRFLGDASAARRVKMPQGAHVVQAVGQFDEHHPYVVAHGEEYLAQRFDVERAPPLGLILRSVGLAGAGDARQLSQLGDAVDLVRDFVTEVTPDFGERNT